MGVGEVEGRDGDVVGRGGVGAGCWGGGGGWEGGQSQLGNEITWDTCYHRQEARGMFDKQRCCCCGNGGCVVFD